MATTERVGVGSTAQAHGMFSESPAPIMIAHSDFISGPEQAPREKDQSGLVCSPKLPGITVDWDSPDRAEHAG